jgi:hypothetical protein
MPYPNKRRGCTPEEPDEGKPQVRFCEGGLIVTPEPILQYGVGCELYSTKYGKISGYAFYHIYGCVLFIVYKQR